MKYSKIVLFVSIILSVGLSNVFAQEPVLKGGQSIALKITGVPQKDQADLNGLYSISDDGSIRLQFIGTVKASGLKPSELAARIESSYRSAEIYTKPTINISINGGDIENQRFVTIMGEIKTPRQVAFTSGMTASDAIAQCGGYTDFGDRRRVKLVRAGVEKTVDLRKVGGVDDAKLQAGDRIVVRQSGFKLFGN